MAARRFVSPSQTQFNVVNILSECRNVYGFCFGLDNYTLAYPSIHIHLIMNVRRIHTRRVCLPSLLFLKYERRLFIVFYR